MINFNNKKNYLNYLLYKSNQLNIYIQVSFISLNFNFDCLHNFMSLSILIHAINGK
jgi:hypothetical protein